MVLINNEKNNINDMLKLAINNKNIEFELLYGKSYKQDINKEQFTNILNHCKDNYDINDMETYLDIRYLDPNKFKSESNNYRFSIIGLTDIKKYCKTNILDIDMNFELLEKKPYEDEDKNINNTYINSDYNYKINLKNENIITEDIQQYIDLFNNNKKYFRYKKRYSFITNNRLWKIDLSIVKSSKFNKKFNTPNYSESFKSANILNEKEDYEIEIEYSGSTIKYNSGLYAIEEYIKNNEFKVEKKTNIYNSDSSTYSSSDSRDKKWTQPGANIKLEEYLDESINILDNYWEKNEDEKIRFDFTDKKLILKEIFYNYEGEYDNGTHVRIETDDKINIVIPAIFIDIKDIKEKNNEEEVLMNSVNITIKDIENINIPSKLKDIEYNENQWFPDIDNILSGTIYKMDKIPQKNTIEYFQLLHLFKYIYNNQELIIKKDIADKYELGSIKNIRPYVIYINNSYQLKYEILNIENIDFDNLSVNIYIEQNPNIINNLIMLLEDLLYDIMRIVIKEYIIISKSNQKDIINQYYELTKQTKKYYKNFVGPQPRQLKIENLYLKNPINILENYLVTEKADGDRYLLYVNKDKNIYLINKKNEVIDTGLNLPNIKGEWLLDGEYIKNDKLDNDIRLFMIFDVYYCENNITKKAYSHPFLSDTNLSRFEILNIFKNYLSNIKIVSEYINIDNQLEIEFKSYQKGFINNNSDISDSIKMKLYKTIFIQSSQIWNKKDNFRYNIDGLIYLPSNLPVKSNLDGKPVDNISGTWDLNFKWKPAYENSIDFQISIKPELIKSQKKDKLFPFIKKVGNSEIISNYKQLLLLVKYFKKKDNTINYCMDILTGEDSKYKDEQLIPFSPPNYTGSSTTNIELTDNKLYTLKDKREIKDNDFVEMRYNPNTDSPLGPWEPLRIRSDKKDPQPFHISNDIWYTIQNEVTEEMIQGDIDINTDYNNDNYYDTENIITTSFPLRKFHNLIKSKLIGLVGLNFGTSINIIDTSVGRGGDIKKYLINQDINCSYLFGLDIYPIEEACKRFYENKNKKTKGIFIQYDTSKSIENEDGYVGTKNEIKHSKILMNILYNKKLNIPEKYKQVRNNYNSIALNGFDIVSCQFSLHYYFKNEKTLRTYLNNLKYICKKGGIFIGTCYDGNDILKLFGEENEIGYIKDNELVYKLEKIKISDFKYNKENISNMFNNSISVFMDSIGDKYIEYLVNFDFFIDIMKEYGFELYEPPKTSKKYNQFINKSIDSFESILLNLSKITDDYELNKFYKKSLDILKDKYLYNLSKTNKYFIFKKVN